MSEKVRTYVSNHTHLCLYSIRRMRVWWNSYIHTLSAKKYILFKTMFYSVWFRLVNRWLYAFLIVVYRRVSVMLFILTFSGSFQHCSQRFKMNSRFFWSNKSILQFLFSIKAFVTVNMTLMTWFVDTKGWSSEICVFHCKLNRACSI